MWFTKRSIAVALCVWCSVSCSSIIATPTGVVDANASRKSEADQRDGGSQTRDVTDKDSTSKSKDSTWTKVLANHEPMHGKKHASMHSPTHEPRHRSGPVKKADAEVSKIFKKAKDQSSHTAAHDKPSVKSKGAHTEHPSGRPTVLPTGQPSSSPTQHPTSNAPTGRPTHPHVHHRAVPTGGIVLSCQDFHTEEDCVRADSKASWTATCTWCCQPIQKRCFHLLGEAHITGCHDYVVQGSSCKEQHPKKTAVVLFVSPTWFNSNDEIGAIIALAALLLLIFCWRCLCRPSLKADKIEYSLVANHTPSKGAVVGTVVEGGVKISSPQTRAIQETYREPSCYTGVRGKVFTRFELSAFDGSDPTKPILLSIGGHVLDVTKSFYLYGSSGPQNCYAGKSITRAAALKSLSEKDIDRGDDIRDFDAKKRVALQGTMEYYLSRFPEVGRLSEWKGDLL